MEETKQAIFQLERFSIPQFEFNVSDDSSSTIDIQLHPSGIYNTSNGEYIVVLVFIASKKKEEAVKEDKALVTATLKAYFTISDKPDFEKIPDFFYQNSLAIIFPYLRAFVSTMTLQSGTPLIVLPLLNLIQVSSTLKENTKVFE